MRKIIVHFDGTGNEPGDAEEKKQNGVIKDENITNILKLHLLAGGNIENQVDKNDDQLSLYYPGVGVRGNIFKRLWRQAFADKAPEVIISEALDDLEKIYKKSDRLYVFGFSRGAAIARVFASRLAKDGLQTATGAIDRHPVISFLGAFDTVASFGKPNLNRNTRPISDVVFENGTISPIIRCAYHLVSIDENRLAFRPTLMNHEPKVNEIWFPGVHSDVGGGYNLDGLSDISLEFMMDRASEYGLSFYGTAQDIPIENLKGRDHNDNEITIDVDDVAVKPDINGKIHTHDELWRDFTNSIAPRNACVVENDVVSRLPYKVHLSVKQRMESDQVEQYDPIPLQDEVFDFVG